MQAALDRPDLVIVDQPDLSYTDRSANDGMGSDGLRCGKLYGYSAGICTMVVTDEQSLLCIEE